MCSKSLQHIVESLLLPLLVRGTLERPVREVNLRGRSNVREYVVQRVKPQHGRRPEVFQPRQQLGRVYTPTSRRLEHGGRSSVGYAAIAIESRVDDQHLGRVQPTYLDQRVPEEAVLAVPPSDGRFEPLHVEYGQEGASTSRGGAHFARAFAAAEARQDDDATSEPGQVEGVRERRLLQVHGALGQLVRIVVDEVARLATRVVAVFFYPPQQVLAQSVALRRHRADVVAVRHHAAGARRLVVEVAPVVLEVVVPAREPVDRKLAHAQASVAP